MPAKRSAMRKIKEILRLKFEVKLSHEKIAAATGVSKGAVTNTLQQAVQKSLAWPLPAELDESALEALLYVKAAPSEHYAQADYALIHQELKRKGVTLQLLWEEYRAATANTRTATASSVCITTTIAARSPARCAKCTAQGRKCSSTISNVPTLRVSISLTL